MARGAATSPCDDKILNRKNVISIVKSYGVRSARSGDLVDVVAGRRVQRIADPSTECSDVGIGNFKDYYAGAACTAARPSANTRRASMTATTA